MTLNNLAKRQHVYRKKKGAKGGALRFTNTQLTKKLKMTEIFSI